MARILFVPATVILGLVLAAASLSAHHRWPVSNAELVTVEGRVVDFKWENPHPMITLNLGTGYGESDFLLAAVANQNISQNTASANFDAAATLRFSATKGINLSYWLDNGNGAYKINTFQASLFVEF